MDKKIKRIIKAYLKKRGSNYVTPFKQDMEQHPYYNEQEKTDTNLVHLDTTHSQPERQEQLDKMLVYCPEESVTQPDWADGDLSSPHKNELQEEMGRTPNDMTTLFDPLRGAGTTPELAAIFDDHYASVLAEYRSPTVASNYDDIDLNSDASVFDDFFEKKSFVKISSFDLDNDFMKLGDDQLIHKSNKDLWKMYKNKNGEIYIQRLFEDGNLQSEE